MVSIFCSEPNFQCAAACCGVLRHASKLPPTGPKIRCCGMLQHASTVGACPQCNLLHHPPDLLREELPCHLAGFGDFLRSPCHTRCGLKMSITDCLLVCIQFLSETHFCFLGYTPVQKTLFWDTHRIRTPWGKCLPGACPARYLCIKYLISSPRFILWEVPQVDRTRPQILCKAPCISRNMRIQRHKMSLPPLPTTTLAIVIKWVQRMGQILGHGEKVLQIVW